MGKEITYGEIIDVLVRKKVLKSHNIDEFFDLQLTRDGYTGTVSYILDAIMEIIKHEIAENKTINLHPDRKAISDRLKSENCSMLAWVILTGKSLAGYDITQEEYDEDIDAALSED